MAYGPHDNPQPDWHQFRHWSPAIWSERRGRSCRIGLPRTLRQRVRLSYCPGNSAAVERLAEEAGGVGLHAGDDVLVHGHGEGGAAVAEAFADDLHVDAGLEQDRGMGVAEVVVMPTFALCRCRLGRCWSREVSPLFGSA